MVMLMSGCFVANQAKENRFYKDAKDHIKDKYGLETKSILFYAKPDRSCSDINGLGRIKYTGAEFGLLELSNGEHVVVSYVDGNYADGYEYYDLYTAWLSKLSDEIGEEVTAVGLVSDDIETYGDTVTEKRIGTFIEKSTVRYNASNVDAFEDAYYSYMQPTEIQMDIYKEDPTEEWIDEVAERLNQYRKNHGVDLLTVEVRSEKPTYEQRIDAADFSNRRIDGGGEYQIWNNYVDSYKNLFYTITIRFGSVTYEREDAYFRRLNEED
jgi:hypothetical protein